MAPTKRVSPVAVDALKDALAAAFWFKEDLRRFLSSAVDDQRLLAGIDWEGNYKRVSVNEFVDRMARNQDRHLDQLVRLMVDVASLDEFPRLARAEDAELKTQEAKAAVERLGRHTKPYEEQLLEQERERERIATSRNDAERARSLSGQLATLNDRFHELHAMDDPHRRGTAFEVFLRDLFKLFDLDPRAAFRITGEQIDGSFVLRDVHFLLEAKWEKTPADRATLDAFAAKVRAKIENTLGLFVAIEGFQATAIEKAFGPRRGDDSCRRGRSHRGDRSTDRSGGAVATQAPPRGRDGRNLLDGLGHSRQRIGPAGGRDAVAAAAVRARAKRKPRLSSRRRAVSWTVLSALRWLGVPRWHGLGARSQAPARAAHPGRPTW